MALTVFVEKMGFFHKGCAGIGVAPVDVCLSPPPGPVPIPYTNVLFAKDLIKGSKTVRIDGEPTFLEDYSETSTSIGDEGGTLGGSVVTGVILGKGYFLVWSMTVQIEGLGVCRHGDMMGQNSASHPNSSPNGGAKARAGNPRARTPRPVASRRAARGKALKGTGPGNSKPVKPKPCAFDKAIVSCSHVGRGAKKRGFGPFIFTMQGTTLKNNLPKRGFKPNLALQVIAGHTDAQADTIKIQLLGRHGYTCAKGHPRIVITDLSTNQAVVRTNGKTTVVFKAKSRRRSLRGLEHLNPAAVIGYFWFPAKIVRRYRVEVNSCGKKIDNTIPGGFKNFRYVIEAWSSDTYKLSISVPEVFNRSYTKAPTRKPTANAQAKTKQGWDKGFRDGSKWFPGGNPINLPAKEIAGSFKFTRNGENIKAATDKISNIAKQIQAVVDAVQGTFNFISDLIPQVGWKFDMKISFMSGSLDFEWGPKEGNHHRTYQWWKLEAEMKLIDFSAEVSFGFNASALGMTIEVVAFLEGSAAVPFKASVESKPHKLNWKGSPLTVSLGLKGGVRVTLGADWLASGKGEVSAGFPFKAYPKVDKRGFRLGYKWEHDACKASVTGRFFLAGSIDEEWELYPKGLISEGTFFEGKPSKGVRSPTGNIK